MTEPITSDSLVSVVIPCYRQGQLLPQAIDSVLAQTHRPIEIVVVNDGSDDDTDAVARGYGNRIVYVSQPNGGLSAARNTGMRTAQGRYLLFLDADDLLHPDAVRWLVEAVNGQDDRVALMGYQFFSTPGEWAKGELPPQTNSLFPWLLHRNYPVHAYLVPTALARSAGEFDASLRSSEDHDFWLRVALISPILCPVSARGAYYRQSSGSMSTNRLRMAQTFAEMVTRFVTRALERPDFLAHWGSDLARMVYASRRRLRVRCGVGAEPESELTAAIRVLQTRGIRPNGPLPVVIQSRLPPWLGDRFERIGIFLARRLWPRFIEGT